METEKASAFNKKMGQITFFSMERLTQIGSSVEESENALLEAEELHVVHSSMNDYDKGTIKIGLKLSLLEAGALFYGPAVYGPRCSRSMVPYMDRVDGHSDAPDYASQSRGLCPCTRFDVGEYWLADKTLQQESHAPCARTECHKRSGLPKPTSSKK